MHANPAFQKSALSVGVSPSTDQPRFERPTPAPAFEPSDSGQAESSPASSFEMARALVELLTQNPQTTGSLARERANWDLRQVLVCAAESRRQPIASMLVDNGYQVFVAEDTSQAVERMRQNKLDVVLLDPQFDLTDQGAAFVTGEVNILRPAQRRRLFFGLISPSFRTLDAHAAFLNNANVTINLNDLADLPAVLDRALREYNELYSDFYHALNIPAL